MGGTSGAADRFAGDVGTTDHASTSISSAGREGGERSSFPLRISDADRQLAGRIGVDPDRVAVAGLALENEDGELVAQLSLDDPLERAGAEGGVEALLGERVLGGLGDLEPDVPLGEALAQAAQLDVD